MNSLKAPRTRFTALALAAALVIAVPAAAQISRNMTLLSTMDIHNTPYLTQGYAASWPYIHSDGREYIVLLTGEGASIVRLTDPAHPVEVGFFGTKVPWTEARQYGHYVYMTTDFTKKFTDDPSNSGLAILDMSNPDQPHKVANLQSPIVNAHSLEIDQQRGLLYLNGEIVCADPDCSGTITLAMKIFSLADPEHPTLVGVYPNYVHHIHLKGTIGYASLLFEGGGTPTDGFCAVLDLSDPANPREITRIVTDRHNQHSGWTTDDGRWLYLDNEVARDGLTVWDVSNVASPRQVFTFEDLPRHVIHKSRVLGNRLYLAYYSAGVRVMDIRNPAWPVEFAYYDTNQSTSDEGNFYGAYDVAPFYPSGIVTVSDDKIGLFVFRVAPVNYGIIRGTLREGSDGPTIAGATVTVLPGNMTVKSGRDGRYAFAVPPGSATVTVSNFAFQTTVRTVSVTLDSDQTLNIGLIRQNAGALSGTLRAASGGAALPGAEVEILGTPLRATANLQGIYTFPSVPEGTYTVRAANPGNAAQAVTLNVPKNKTTKQDFSLGGVTFYDDAETDRGWTLGDPSDTGSGAWERAMPSGRVLCDDGQLIEPALDHSPGSGNKCFTTNTFFVPCFTLAGGVLGFVTVTSPILHMAGVSDPRIGYWRWFQTIEPGVNTLAPLVVKLSGDGGTTWVTVENYLTARSAWEFAEIRVRDFISNPGDVLLRFSVDNRAHESIEPEAAIDDIAVYAGNGGSAMASAALEGSPAFAIGAPRPSPTHGFAEVELTLQRSLHVRADIYDIQGRRVQTAVNRDLPAGSSMVRWNGKTAGGASAASGIYWMAIRAGEEERKLKIVVIR